MAGIFLSYARDDARKAQALARFLERAGHSVWWDRHIDGGSEFAGEIEAALREADAVVVLWSRASIKSAWVRDEAAEGRDSGRLIPVLLDDCAPPLGFRQIQSVPLAGWSGRGNPPHRQALLDAIDRRRAHAEPSGAAPTRKAASSPRYLAAGIAVVLALAALVGGWWLLEDRGEASSTPVLAVLPFSDLSAEGDKAYFAEGVAEAILTVLAKDPGIRVLGSNSARQLQQAGSEAAEMRRAMGITHVLEGSARSVGDQLRMSVRLVNASDGRQIWAEEYQRRLDNVFAVQDEIGRAVAAKLRGSFGPVAQSAQPITKADIYALYLAARSKMRDRRQSSLTEALRLARRVIEADPNYAPGHAIYAELAWHLSIDNYGTLPEDQARTVAQRHARRAIELAPDSADGYAALGLTLADHEAIAPLKKAIDLDPARAELRQWLGHNYADNGRHAEALEQFRAAVEMDPLWIPGAMLLAYTLGSSGRYDEAEQSIAAFQRRGGSAAVAAKIRGDIANYSGDYSEAVRQTAIALKLDPETPQADLSAGWYNFLLGLHDQAAAATKRFPPYARLQMSGRHDQLLDRIRSDGVKVWDQADAYVAIEALAFARDWRTISNLIAAKPEVIAEICADTEMIQTMINMAVALRSTGRTAQSRRLADCAQAKLALQARGPVRSSYIPSGWLHGLQAQVHALRGDAARAFAELSLGVDLGVRTAYGRGLSDLPAFDRLRADPAYAPLDRRLKQLMARERAEAIADLRRSA